MVPPKSRGHTSLRVVIWSSVGLVRLRSNVRDCASSPPSNPRSTSLNSTGHCRCKQKQLSVLRGEGVAKLVLVEKEAGGPL
eukprot:6097988-Pyramimonas_sp.AAC.1